MAISIPIWSDDFLESDLREQPEYRASVEESAEFDAFVGRAREALRKFLLVSEPNEEHTIDLVIGPILQALGWESRSAKLRLTSQDEVDLAIYADSDRREQLLRESQREQVWGATGIVECKRWQRDFDAAGSGSPNDSRRGETAAQQIQRYLLIGAADSSEALRWGMLSNGARWRLYSARARPRERYWEIDLEALLAPTDLFGQAPGDDAIHRLRSAWLLLRRDSWVAADGERESFLDRLLDAGRRRDAAVADDLSDVIFNHVYPDIVRLFWEKQPDASGDEIARAAQLFLYRLLFIYYAEDRGMLNTEDERYRPYSLRYSVRDPVAQQRGAASEFSTVSRNYWQRLTELRRIIDQGDSALGQPAYNGGLFAGYHAILDEIDLSDAELAPIIHQLSHTTGGVYISYRNLEVQQLGSIYERLLERKPRRDAEGEVTVAISPYARKDSGSYYTPQELVDLIVEQTLRPLADERIEAFRREPVEANDPAEAILRLRILDPAMGSGHFLISALDWLTSELSALVYREWKEAPGYVSPLLGELRELRDAAPRLGEQTLLQRMALKRCMYGVDKNPMAVELARVALWLHTFTGELPLPRLEHRLVSGDSLLGIRGEQANAYLDAWGHNPIGDSIEEDTQRAALDTVAADEQLDMDMDGIERSRKIQDSASLRVIERQRSVLDLVAGLRWQAAGMKVKEREAFHAPLAELLGGHSGRAISVLFNGENEKGKTSTTAAYRQIRDTANEIAEREGILHWEIAFPHVMLAGGFDAVIGNPPWDVIKLQEVEWWKSRDLSVVRTKPAAARKQLVAHRREAGDQLVAEFDAAAAQAAELSTLIRTCGDYPLLGKGDINLYSLFVERSLTLLKPDGICGLLTPSGIYSDKPTADFFRSISTTGRLAGVYDFENRRSANPEAKSAKWFADVDSRFKFCVTITGGAARRFDEAMCGFFLNGVADLKDGERVFALSPDDFARINPNTGTAPLLRSRRDAEIISRIYREHPVLADRSRGEERKLYPLRYHTMFHMTNDSDLFHSADQLVGEGAYQVVGNRYKRGEEEWLPLYQGRTIHQFDHRANSVEVNPESTHNPYNSKDVTDEQHADPYFAPGVQYWVAASEVSSRLSDHVGYVLAFRNIARATDERTMIATIAPIAGYGHSIPLLLTEQGFSDAMSVTLIANLNSLVFDYVAKRKLTGTNMTLHVVEQLPLIHPDQFEQRFGELTAGELARDHALRLTYTAHDLTPFARLLGYEGEPFRWNPRERRQLRARLDALFFHLYGLSEEEAEYVLDQFAVLEKNERKQFGGYLTKHLTLNQYRALAAGDASAEIPELLD